MNQGLSIEAVMIEAAIDSAHYNKNLAARAIDQVPDAKLHQPLDDETNSISVIVKHIAGNLISRWTDFLESDGEKPWRHRDSEFVDTFSSRRELMDYWEQGWERLTESLSALRQEDLSKTVHIRGVPHSVPLAIFRSVTHSAYHVGQIVMIARIHAGENWKTLTIPRDGSQAFNDQYWGKAT